MMKRHITTIKAHTKAPGPEVAQRHMCRSVSGMAHERIMPVRSDMPLQALLRGLEWCSITKIPDRAIFLGGRGFELGLKETTGPAGGTQKGEYWVGPTNDRAAESAFLIYDVSQIFRLSFFFRSTKKKNQGKKPKKIWALAAVITNTT